MKDKRVSLILGGLSKEREISLKTGEAIFKALTGLGYQVSKFDPKHDDIIFLRDKTDVAFIALHGKYGEDGCIQGLLETLGIPYTGAGVMASATCYDKIRTKLYLKNYNVLTPEFWIFDSSEEIADFIAQQEFNFPVIVKPNREGSTFGATIVKENTLLSQAIADAARYDQKVLIEHYIVGDEVTVAVLDGKALPSIEIVPKSGFYDFESKYTPGKTEYHVPARISDALNQHLARLSEDIVRHLDCRGAPRVDYMIDKKNEPYFLEINTIPGMTETSLLPKAARGVGIEFAELCERILLSARLDNKR